MYFVHSSIDYQNGAQRSGGRCRTVFHQFSNKLELKLPIRYSDPFPTNQGMAYRRVGHRAIIIFLIIFSISVCPSLLFSKLYQYLHLDSHVLKYLSYPPYPAKEFLDIFYENPY